MKVRICPLCDQPMTKAHHCDSCNSFIWKPQYLDIHYNTDTMKGQDCSYNSEEHAYNYHEDGSVTTMPRSDRLKKRRRENENDETKKTVYPVYRKPVEERRSASEKQPIGRIKLILILAIVFSIISQLIAIFSSAVERKQESFFGTAANQVIEDTQDISGEDDEGWYSDGERVEYSDEEVMAGGKECTGIAHMDITAEEFIAAAEPELAELGMDMSQFSEESNNYSYDYGRDNSYTYFTQERMYDMDISVGYYNVTWDTFSKRLHEVSYNVCDSDRTEDFYVATMQALTGNGEKFRKEFQKQRNIAEKDEYVFFDTDEYEVYINYYEGYSESYYVSITKVM